MNNEVQHPRLVVRRGAKAFFLFALLIAVNSFAEEAITLRQEQNQVVITADSHPIATYVFADKEISRPYFAHVYAPGKIQVTRNHPPDPAVDAVDHATMHPGIWLAFGNLSDRDYWRNRAPVRHVRFRDLQTEGTVGAFTVENEYLHSGEPADVVCHETCRYTISIEPNGYLLVCDSMFISPKAFWFGDQEEMGLGVRMATKLTVKAGGGEILDSAGRMNEKQIWSKAADWCDYRGTLKDHQVGILVMSDPANFRPMRLHVRDYGLLAANPFGQKVFGEAETSRVDVPANTPFRLRFAILIHASEGKHPDCQAVYNKVTARMKEMQRPSVPR